MKPLSVNGIVEGIEEVRAYLDAHGYDASQMGIPSASAVGEGPQDGGQQAQKARKTKLQLWNDLKISCKLRKGIFLF